MREKWKLEMEFDRVFGMRQSRVLIQDTSSIRTVKILKPLIRGLCKMTAATSNLDARSAEKRTRIRLS